MKNLNARALLIGDGFSAFGSWIDFLAILTMAAYQFKVNAFEMGIVSAALLLPGILLARRIGSLCDTGNTRMILQWSLLGRLALTCAIILSANFYLFLAFLAARSVFASVAPPAINVVAVRSIGDDDRPRFYSALNILNNSAKIIAPAVGTIASSLSSETFALAMSAVFTLAGFLSFAFLQPTPAREVAPSTGRGSEAKAASVGPLLYVAGTYAFFVFMVNNLVPLALQRADFDKSLLGILVSASGTGSILTGLWLAKRKGPQQPSLAGVILPAGMQAFGFVAIGLVLLYLRPFAPVLLGVCFFIIGTFGARYAITSNVYLTNNFADRIGAASSAIQAWQNAMILVAPLVGAVILERSGPGMLFIAAAATGLFAYSAMLFHMRLSRQRLIPRNTAAKIP